MEMLFVTGNAHKVMEANAALKKYGIALRMADCRKVEIQAESLSEIASYAANEASNKLGLPVVVEDSGFFVEALRGFPGPYSSFVYKTLGCEGILRLIEGKADRRASFQCSVAFARPGRSPLTFMGSAEGTLSEQPRGSHGFGFDPIFISDGESRTFAEMSAEEKDRLSHRGSAFRNFGVWASSIYSNQPQKS